MELLSLMAHYLMQSVNYFPQCASSSSFYNANDAEQVKVKSKSSLGNISPVDFK